MSRAVTGIVFILAFGWRPAYAQTADAPRPASAGAAESTGRAGGRADAGETARHRMTVTLRPAEHRLIVDDTIELPPALRRGAPITFTLNAGLEIRTCEPPVKAGPSGGGGESPSNVGDSGVHGGDSGVTDAFSRRYVLEKPPADGVLHVTYEGVLNYGLSDQKEEYTRGFRESRGVIGPEGVYLHGGSGWFPSFGDGLIRFELTVAAPEGWEVISAGGGTSRGADGRARWTCDEPVEDIDLVGGPLRVARAAAGKIEALVYLHEADDALAQKYLDATARYVALYDALIGPYPYPKFALVENFWETGYGMPSFTLLGPQVIRFPFILTSSYPHEILHNWWGNSVFVDYAGGNWCEGLTAYLADHLLQEQQGLGGQYRRGALQKYRNYVNENRDFPLAQFRARHDAATEAVGYGKSLMLFHMLRRQIGDEKFKAGLRALYQSERGKRAAFSDLQRAFAHASGDDLDRFFDQWVSRSGAPSLALGEVKATRTDLGYRITGVLSQTQDGEPFALQAPICVQTTAGQQMFTVAMRAEKRSSFEFTVQSPPHAIAVDPFFDVFRLLDPLETPASIGQLFGEPDILAVLPKASEGDLSPEAYAELIKAWQSDQHHIRLVNEGELDTLPPDRAAWILGRSNRFAPMFLTGHGDVALGDSGDALNIGDRSLPFAGHTFVVIRRNPQDPRKALGWIVVDPPAAIAGVARKLPHYGKYSYLAFEGAAPTNVVKGQSECGDSPLIVRFEQTPGRAPAFKDDRAPLVPDSAAGAR